jgi:hypothetical protein
MEPQDGYSKAREILRERFGNDFVITKVWLDRVTTGRSIRASEPTALQTYADDLKSCLEVFSSMNKIGETDTTRSLCQMVERLPAHLQHRWRHRAVECAQKNGSYPTIKEFVKFVSMAATEANDPLFGTSGHFSTKSAKAHLTKEKPIGRTLLTQDTRENGKAEDKNQNGFQAATSSSQWGSQTVQ